MNGSFADSLESEIIRIQWLSFRKLDVCVLQDDDLFSIGDVSTTFKNDETIRCEGFTHTFRCSWRNFHRFSNGRERKVRRNKIKFTQDKWEDLSKGCFSSSWFDVFPADALMA